MRLSYGDMAYSASCWAKQQDLLLFWHSYRLLVVALLVASVLVAQIWRWRRAGASRRARPPSPTAGIEAQDVRAEVSFAQGLEEKIHDDAAHTLVLGALAAKSMTRKRPRIVKGRASNKKTSPSPIQVLTEQLPLTIQPQVFYASLSGSTEAYAKSLVRDLQSSFALGISILEPQLHEIPSLASHEDYFTTIPKTSNAQYFYLILLPTYNISTFLDAFLEHLRETHHDFRIDTAPLSGILGYSVFGFGDKEGWPSEEEGFCSQAKQVDRWMAKLTGRKRAYPLGMGDLKSDVQERFYEWTEGVKETMRMVAETGSLGEGVSGSGDAVESDEEEDDKSSVQNNGKNQDSQLADLEDIGQSTRNQAETIAKSPFPVDFTTSSPNNPSQPTELKPMVPSTSSTYAALTKQGYSIIGTHSGVKICRWTKSALRGRGSCYKRSFYGIASHLCMETTPSLSCSNKCVFCWRHGTNPVSTSWKWQVDPPELIFTGAKEAHLKKIKALRGVPGVRAERFQEAQRIRHCALSLVGEPIFYPHINKFLSLLHSEHISSFLVCNAQHPDQLAALGKVTQLYVSIDASNRDSLRKIDRPLHRDFWERFTRCLDILRERRSTTRTVFRLTLVKGFNMADEVSGYADLVARGLPAFVEIKGVTYCGTSTSAAAGLSMQNVPFYEEVAAFVVALNDELNKRGLDYGIAAEHAHSCCVLLASTRFKRDGKWCTLIDYDRFFQLLESGRDFSPEEYMGDPTPEWALWGRGGFDPADERVDRRGKKIEA